MPQDDILCLASVLEDEDLTRGYLAAEGYGARICHLEPDRSTSGNVSYVRILKPRHLQSLFIMS